MRRENFGLCQKFFCIRANVSVDYSSFEFQTELNWKSLHNLIVFQNFSSTKCVCFSCCKFEFILNTFSHVIYFEIRNCSPFNDSEVLLITEELFKQKISRQEGTWSELMSVEMWKSLSYVEIFTYLPSFCDGLCEVVTIANKSLNVVCNMKLLLFTFDSDTRRRNWKRYFFRVIWLFAHANPKQRKI